MSNLPPSEMTARSPVRTSTVCTVHIDASEAEKKLSELEARVDALRARASALLAPPVLSIEDILEWLEGNHPLTVRNEKKIRKILMETLAGIE